MRAHEILETTLIVGHDEIQNGQPRELVDAVVPEHVEVGRIRMNVHAIMDICDGIPGCMQ